MVSVLTDAPMTIVASLSLECPHQTRRAVRDGPLVCCADTPESLGNGVRDKSQVASG